MHTFVMGLRRTCWLFAEHWKALLGLFLVGPLVAGLHDLIVSFVTGRQWTNAFIPDDMADPRWRTALEILVRHPVNWIAEEAFRGLQPPSPFPQAGGALNTTPVIALLAFLVFLFVSRRSTENSRPTTLLRFIVAGCLVWSIVCISLAPLSLHSRGTVSIVFVEALCIPQWAAIGAGYSTLISRRILVWLRGVDFWNPLILWRTFLFYAVLLAAWSLAELVPFVLPRRSPWFAQMVVIYSYSRMAIIPILAVSPLVVISLSLGEKPMSWSIFEVYERLRSTPRRWCGIFATALVLSALVHGTLTFAEVFLEEKWLIGKMAVGAVRLLFDCYLLICLSTAYWAPADEKNGIVDSAKDEMGAS